MTAFDTDKMRAKVEAAQREAELLAKVQAGLHRADFPIQLAYAGGYRSEVALTLEASDRETALSLAQELKPVRCLFYRGTFAGFVPADSFNREKERAQMVKRGIKPIAWKAATFLDRGRVSVSTSLLCWADIGGVRCHVTIKIASDPAACELKREKDERGRVTREWWQWSGLPMAGEQVSFSGGPGQPNSRLAYFLNGYGF